MKKSEVLFTTLITICVIAVYGQIIFHTFLNYDTANFYFANSAILNHDYERLFTSQGYGGFFPISLLLFYLQHLIFGDSAQAIHMVSLIIHCLNSCLLFHLLHKKFAIKELAVFFAVMLFAIHPLHTENIVWVAEQRGLWATLFLLLSLNFWVINQKAASFIFGLLAYGSKAISYPLAIVFLFLERKKLKDKRTLIFLLFNFIAVLSCALAEILKEGRPLEGQSILLDQPWLTPLYSLLFHIGKTWLPLDTYIIYPAKTFIPGVWEIVGAILFVISFIMIIRIKDKKPELLLGYGFFFLFLFPTLKILPFGIDSITNDRYHYLPSLGLAFIVAIVLENKPKNWKFGIAGILVIFFSITSFRYTSKFKNPETLWAHVIKRFPKSDIAYSLLGLNKLTQSDYYGARDYYKRSLAINPKPGITSSNMKLALKKISEIEKDIDTYKELFNKEPNNYAYCEKLFIAHRHSHQYQIALNLLKRCEKFAPKHRLSVVHANFSLIYQVLGQEKLANDHEVMAKKLYLQK